MKTETNNNNRINSQTHNKTKTDEYEYANKYNDKNVELIENSLIYKENTILRHQNKILKKELMQCQNQLSKYQRDIKLQDYKSPHKSRKTTINGPEELWNLRETIKKDAGDIKQLKVQLNNSVKLCRSQEEVIERLQERIRKNNKQLENQKHTIDNLNKQKRQSLEEIKQKLNCLMNQYSDLEKKMHNNELQWVTWKEQWLNEKNHYLHHIKTLENSNKKQPTN